VDGESEEEGAGSAAVDWPDEGDSFAEGGGDVAPKGWPPLLAKVMLSLFPVCTARRL